MNGASGSNENVDVDLSSQNLTDNSDNRTFNKKHVQKMNENGANKDVQKRTNNTSTKQIHSRINLTSLILNDDDNVNNASSEEDRKEAQRIEKLRAKYLRSSVGSKFT